MSEGPHNAEPSWTRALTGILSPYALGVLERSGARRDPAQTCSIDALTALLRGRRLPVFEAAIELERHFGGVTWEGDTFGVCAALRSGVDLRTLAGLTGGDLEEYLGEPVVPIRFREHPPRAYYWMNAAGVIHMVNEVEHYPAADSAACFWEREALKKGEPGAPALLLQWSAMPTFTDADWTRFEGGSAGGDEEDDDAPPAQYEQDPQASLDEAFAKVVGLPLFKPATDRWRRVWFDGSRLLFPHYPRRSADRLVRAGNMDDLVRLARAAKEVRPNVLATYKGPLEQAPSSDEPVAVTLLAYEEGKDVVGELLFTGTPGAYRAHLRLHNEPLSLYRLWQEREEAWRARG
jgi:hypothetical protein